MRRPSSGFYPISASGDPFDVEWDDPLSLRLAERLTQHPLHDPDAVRAVASLPLGLPELVEIHNGVGGDYGQGEHEVA